MQRIFAALLLVCGTLSAALNDGLVAYYKEDVANMHTDSISGYNGTEVDAVGYAASGKIGGASTYAGTGTGNDGRTRSLLPNVQGWTGGTISVWVKNTAYSSVNNYTIAQVREGGSWGHLWLHISPLGIPTERQVFFHIGTGQGFAANAISTTKVQDNTWYHVVGTWDKTTNTAAIFVNGTLEQTVTVPAWGQTTNEFYWGAGFNGYGVNGATDEIGIWNRPLSPAEISAVYNGGAGLSYPFSTTYQIQPQYDATKAVKSGAVLPLKIQVLDTAGNNISSSTLLVRAISLTYVSGATTGDVASPGNSNPDNNFSYDSSLVGYTFNLSTKGLAPGTYNINYTIGTGTNLYASSFMVR